MDMFHAHDARSIRRIQDAFDCCGLNSIRDRAYPFPNTAPSSCAETYGRTSSCREPWSGALQTLSLLDFSVVLGVGLIQILGLLLARKDSSGLSNWRNRDRGQSEQHRDGRRTLLIDRDRNVIEEEETTPQRPERSS